MRNLVNNAAVGGKGVRSPLDGLKSSSGKGSYTDPHKTPGQIAEIPVSFF